MPFNVEGSRISIQGLGLGNCEPVIEFPSGLVPSGESGRNLPAVLASVNANFGFNLTPHSFKTTWVPTSKFELLHGASGNLPLTGRIIGFNVGSFLVSGIITHSDYRAAGNAGTIINIDIQDIRHCIDKIKIHTEDLSTNPGQSGIISVARGYRIKQGLFNAQGQVDDALFFEYQNILENGCTYPQILEAIQLAIDDGEIDFDINSLPTISQLEANIGGSASALRFKFAMAPLTEVISRVCQDTAYDWYWNMSESAVYLINRKTPFDLSEQNLLDVVARLGGSGLKTVTSLGYGKDMIPEPRRARLLGAKQEGFINSHLVGPIDGLDTPSSGIVFEPAWRNLTVAFYDHDGFLRSYKPTDVELKMALNGIETWSYFKKYQSTSSQPLTGPSGFGLPPDAGSIAAQHPTFESRLDPTAPLAGQIAGNEEGSFRVINNRRDEEHNWVIDFFSRVEDHATRHFGKSYVTSGILVNAASGKFNLVNSAWANVENQIEGQTLSVNGSSGLFVPNYEINRQLGPLAPFKTVDDKISAHCRLPSGTVYGPLGEDAPASFGAWTEDAAPFNPSGDGSHYIPVNLTEVGQEAIDPRGGLDLAFEAYPDGTILCQLPELAGSGLSQDFVLGNLITLVENGLAAQSSGLEDIFDLSYLVQPYEHLSGVAIPVQANIRYGMGFPDTWASGQLAHACDTEEVDIDDSFAPWNFPPQGNQTSLTIMSDRAWRKLQGRIISADASQFASVDIVGMPAIGFDSFADQTPNVSGQIGTRSHGVTDLTFSFGGQGFSTTYKVASFFSEFGREAPLGPRNRSILNGIINPIDFTEFQLLNNITPPRPRRPSPGGGFNPPQQETQVTRTRVNITIVNNALAFGEPDPDPFTQERYRGVSRRGVVNPVPDTFSNDPDRNQGAICIDGFLNVGDEATYVVERILTRNTTFGTPQVTYLRYFQGGRPFANGTVVRAESEGSTPGTFVLSLEGTNPKRKLTDIPVLNGAVSLGERTTIVAQAGSENNAQQRALGRFGQSLTPSGVYVQGVAATTRPAQVTAAVSGGTSSAIVTVQLLDVSGLATGDSFGGVIPFPFPQFVQVGDQGMYATAATPSGTAEVFQRFFFSNRSNFIRFS